MSQKSVEIVIGRLATDEDLRVRFVADPRATLHGLGESGLEFNPAETEALLEIPEVLWVVLALWIHPRLQKISLRGSRAEP